MTPKATMHWYNDTRPPRHLTAQSSAMYAGTVPESKPNAEPRTIRPASRAPKLPAAASNIAPAVNRRDEEIGLVFGLEVCSRCGYHGRTSRVLHYGKGCAL